MAGICTAATEEVLPDWSELIQELVHLIAKKLPDLLDFVRFRAVCPRWRSAVSTSDSPPPQLFWLVRDLDSPGRISMCCLDANFSTTMSMDLPQLSGKSIYIDFLQQYRRYMIFADEEKRCLSLLNPLNRREIALPALPPINASTNDFYWIGTYEIENCEHVFVPMHTNNSSSDEVRFCKIGDDNWKSHKLEESTGAFGYYNRMFFVHGVKGVTEVIDVTTGSVQFVIPPPEDPRGSYFFDLFVVSCGKLLGIIAPFLYFWHGVLDDEFVFRIYEFECENGKPRWVETNNIGDQFLLLHYSLEGCLSLKFSDYPGFQQNCIYYFEESKIGSCLIRYNIENRSGQKLPFPDNVVSYFLPSFV